MTRVEYAQAALDDLDHLAAFLLDTDAHAASTTVELVLGAVDTLHLHPLMGRPAEAGLRELVISRGRSGYLALYRWDPLADRVTVLAIRHQREAGYTASDG